MPEIIPAPFDLMTALAQTAKGTYKPPPGLLANAAGTISEKGGDNAESPPPSVPTDEGTIPGAALDETASPKFAAKVAAAKGEPPPPEAPAPAPFDLMTALAQTAKGAYKAPPASEQAPQGAPASDTSTLAGAAGAVPSGLYAGVASLANLPTAAVNLGSDILHGLGATPMGHLQPPIEENPTGYVPQGTAERAIYSGAKAVGQLPGFALGGEGLAAAAPEGSTLATVGKGLAQGGVSPRAAADIAGGAAAGQAAEDAVPDPYKPYVNLGANILGAGGIEGAIALTRGAGAVGRAALGAVGRAGIGPKITIGDWTGTASQAEAAGKKITTAAGGPEELAAGMRAARQSTYAANDAAAAAAGAPQARQPPTVNRATGETELGPLTGALQPGSINPETGELVPGGGALSPETGAILPGETPTLFQATGNRGVGALETSARKAAPAAFEDQAAAQGKAALAHVNAIQPSGDSQAVADAYVGHLRSLEDAQAADATAGNAAVAKAGTAFGEPMAAEDAGAAARQTIEAQRKAARVPLDAEYAKIDPNGTAALPVAQAPAAAAKALAEMKPTLRSKIPGASDAVGLLEEAKKMPAVVPLSDLRQMQSVVGASLRSLRANPQIGAESLPYRWLASLQEGLYNDLRDAVANHAEQQAAAVRAGALDRSETLAAKMGRNQTADGVAARAANTATGSQGPASGGNAGFVLQPPGGGIPGESVGGSSGTGRPAGGGYGPAARGPGLAGKAPPLEPNLTGETAAALQKANAEYGQYKETYRPIRKMLAGTDRQVAQRLLNPENARAYLKAAGRSDESLARVREALAADLHAKGILRPDGSVEGKGLAGWTKSHTALLDEVKELRPLFANAQKAADTVAETQAAHGERIKQFQKETAGKVLEGNPEKTIGAALDSGDPRRIKALADLTRGNADAEAGLKRAALDHLVRKMEKGAEPFQQWISDNRRSLKILFGGQGINRFDAAAAVLKRQEMKAKVPLGAAGKKYKFSTPSGHGNAVLALIGEHFGESLKKGIGAVTGAIGLPFGAGLVRAARAAGVQSTHDLIVEGLLHPDLMPELLKRLPDQANLSAMHQKRLAARLTAVAAANVGAAQNQAAPN